MGNLEAEGLFPLVRIQSNLFPHAYNFLNTKPETSETEQKLIIFNLSGAYSKNSAENGGKWRLCLSWNLSTLNLIIS